MYSAVLFTCRRCPVLGLGSCLIIIHTGREIAWLYNPGKQLSVQQSCIAPGLVLQYSSTKHLEKEGKSTPPMARRGFPGFLSWRRIPACLLPLQLNHSGILNCQKCNLELGFISFGEGSVKSKKRMNKRR